MERREWCRLVGGGFMLSAGAAAGVTGQPGAPGGPLRAPLSAALPDLGCWFWKGEEAFHPGAYRKFVDAVADHSVYQLLTTSLRAPNSEITRPEVHDRLAEATRYAAERGLGVVLDLDVRLARRAFQERYPDEMQEMLRLRESDLSASDTPELRIESETLNDHYTGGGAEFYVPLAGRLVRVYSYRRADGRIDPTTVRDITDECEVLEASAQAVHVRLPNDDATACVLVAFSLLAADVFAPHLLEFQAELIELYADAPLMGVCKDEWGFPPCFDACPEHNDFWYSEPMRRAYAEATDGRELLRDCLLMYAGEAGREADRQGCINRFQELCRARNALVEQDFYRVTKRTFGKDAVVATHPTWYPYPGVEEFKKNGLSWWQSTRDWAQTDELTPYCCRTALAKKWGSSVWYNMYYSPDKGTYERGIWAYVLAGGRMNCHPLYPLPGGSDSYDLMRGGLMHGMARIRLLNYISDAALDCPVAVLFGHYCAMNWAGPSYGDSGVGLADALWAHSYPADLIPTSEVANGSLRVDAKGRVAYGSQRYAALVVYHPEFEGRKLARFLNRAQEGGGTDLLAVGEWTRDFLGEPFDAESELGRLDWASDADECLASVLAGLNARGVVAQTPATDTVTGFGRTIAQPPAKGRCRLIDGTEIMVAGAGDPAGDAISGQVELAGVMLEVDAVGLVAVRVDGKGGLVAFVAGGLRSLEGGGLGLQFDGRPDIALWRDGRGRWHGVIQDLDGPLPAALEVLTDDWLRLSTPSQLP